MKHIDGMLGNLDSAKDVMVLQQLTNQELCLNWYKELHMN